jgi:uncharacterized protein (AIM24 family)
MMDETCDLDVEMIQGATNILFGEQGLFVTKVTGPGRIVVQTMPIAKMVREMTPYLPSAKTVTTTTTSNE